MASLLAQFLSQKAPELQSDAFPIVGEGHAYRDRDIPIVGVQQVMPTGGFILKGKTNLLIDVRAGLIGLTRRQFAALRRLSSQYDWAVAVGDIYVLFLAGFAMRRPAVFLPTAKSEYIRGHDPLDYRLMRKYSKRIYPRDKPTHDALAKAGLPSRFAGNMMMDHVDVEGVPLGLPLNRKVVALLPGSRGDAPGNLVEMLAVVDHLASDSLTNSTSSHATPLSYVVALAPSLQMDEIEKKARQGGWKRQDGSGETETSGKSSVVGRLGKDGQEVVCVKGAFGDVLAAADLVLGMAGTGNEQAAGLGKPVVTFPGPGTQFTLKFARDQKRLLGEAVSLVESGDPRAVASEILRILSDADVYDRMAQVGRERMGNPGATKRIAEELAELLVAQKGGEDHKSGG